MTEKFNKYYYRNCSIRSQNVFGHFPSVLRHEDPKKKRTHKRATGEQEELVQILNSEH